MSRCCLVVLVAAVAACGYTAPDYSDAQFRCDETHPCPGGQVCVDELCQLPGTESDASSGVDAQFAGITCGDDICDLTDECCVDVISGTRCQPPGAFCTGPATVCDGPEDCPGGECCLSASFAGVCTAVGTCSGSTACHETTDCTDGSETCCDIVATAWRGCFGNCPN
ncbi:MAG TPA: hypothetical protein VM261_07035 [Kofleriaceae bacterium]|nr:hypothetical protein [Kofleriaceae bacterium]